MINYHSLEVQIKLDKVDVKKYQEFEKALEDFLNGYSTEEIQFEVFHMNFTPYSGLLNRESHLEDVKNGCTCTLIEEMSGTMAYDEHCPVHWG